MSIQQIVILGSTGSIGTQTLDVISRHPDRFKVFALSAFKNADLLFNQCIEFQPSYAVIGDEKQALSLAHRLKSAGSKTELLIGIKALEEIAITDDVDTVIAGIVGAAGLLSTFAAVKAGKRVLIANKEPLVMAGELFMNTAKVSGAIILPVDSEHNAIFQCLADDFIVGHEPQHVEKIILTASGGPFRNTPIEELKNVTPEQAIAHPNWKMGPKISVDCATMINKGLEIIEAHWLFNMPMKKIEALIHPQSIVHAIVQFLDGSSIAQLGFHDMRTPIANALAWPDRVYAGVKHLDLAKVATLEFKEVDLNKYPCFKLAYDAIEAGGAASIVLNAANEVAVDAFLNGRLDYLDIPIWIERHLSKEYRVSIHNIEEIIQVDKAVRELEINHNSG